MYDINTQQFSKHLKQEYRRLHSKTHVHNSVKSWRIFKILSLRFSGKFAVRFTVGRTEMQQSILVLFLGVLCYKKLPESSTAKPELNSTWRREWLDPISIFLTRSSATTDGPRDALCQSKSCQLYKQVVIKKFKTPLVSSQHPLHMLPHYLVKH